LLEIPRREIQRREVRREGVDVAAVQPRDILMCGERSVELRLAIERTDQEAPATARWVKDVRGAFPDAERI